MDFNQLNQQLNDALNRWLAAGKEYFSHLTQMEMYGWGAFGFGFVLSVVGFILL